MRDYNSVQSAGEKFIENEMDWDDFSLKRSLIEFY